MKTYDIIIIGGGVIGSSIAHYASKSGKRVLLLEKNTMGSGASSAAAGLLGVQAEWEVKDRLYGIAKNSSLMFPSLAEELRESTGIDIGYRASGIYKIAVNEEEKQKIMKTMKWQRAAGEEVEWLDKVELLHKENGVSSTVQGGAYYPGDGHVLAPELTNAFVQSAINKGAEVREHTEVHEIIIENSVIKGVQTTSGTFYGESVVVAGGAWSSPFLTLFQQDLGTYPVKGVCLSVKSNSRLLHAPLFNEGFYIVPKAGGRYIIGATMEPYSYDKNISSGDITTLLDRAITLVPGIKGAIWEKAWAGFRPQSTLNEPYMGRHPWINGLYACTGHYRNGILLSPISGMIMNDLLDGHSVDDVEREVSLFGEVKG